MPTVDLGCGVYKRGDIGIDMTSGTTVDIVCQLGFEAIPLEDGTIDKVFAYDFLEHLPKLAYGIDGGKWRSHRPHLFLFNEVHRILKPGGIFETVTPVVEPEVNGRALHVSHWNEETFRCFATQGFPKEAAMIWKLEADMMRWHGYTASFELTEYSEVAYMPGARKTHGKAVFKAIK